MKYTKKQKETQERILKLNRELAKRLWGAYHPTPDMPHPYSFDMVNDKKGSVIL